VYFELQMTDIV